MNAPMKTENMNEDVYSKLLAAGWREYANRFKEYARCFYKRFETPTRCYGNKDKEGMQIQISVSEHEGRVSMEMELCAGLSDGTWLKIQNYALPETVDEVTALIPRMLAVWEMANNMTNSELKKWLHENSSGTNHPAKEAANLIEQLERDLAKAKSALTKEKDMRAEPDPNGTMAARVNFWKQVCDEL
jgi:hypothetical protein